MIVPGPMENRRDRRAIPGPGAQAKAAFTLVEMIAAMAVALVLMGLILSMVTVMSKSWSHAAETVSTYEKARSAFENLTETLGQATCNSYWDYVNASGNPQTTTSSDESFVPVGYKRNSELHFISGPAANLTVTGLTPATTQGDAVFFQSNTGRTTNSNYKTLTSSLNSVGFFIQYWNDNTQWPQFIQNATASTPNYRYRLMEWLQPTDSVHIYDSTVGANAATWNINWINTYFKPYPPDATPKTGALALADNITLLVLLPKLTPEDEADLNGGTPASPGTLLCPNYCYDSRAWMGGGIVSKTSTLGSYNLSDLERNQLPPLVDVVMIAVDERNVILLQKQHSYSASPPPELQVPANSFTDSTKLATDLQTYENQLISYHINFRLFRSTVEIQAAKWSMPNY